MGPAADHKRHHDNTLRGDAAGDAAEQRRASLSPWTDACRLQESIDQQLTSTLSFGSREQLLSGSVYVGFAGHGLLFYRFARFILLPSAPCHRPFGWGAAEAPPQARTRALLEGSNHFRGKGRRCF